MRFDIITIFPKIFDSYFNESILKRAIKRKTIQVKIHNLRDFTRDKHKKVDDKPYGGGAGMVLMAEPILKAVVTASRRIKNRESRIKRALVVLLSAKGKLFDQKLAYQWARKFDNIVLISGRYEGIDERVKAVIYDSGFLIQEVSIGPYVLTDGDVAAMAVISAVTRLLPGVIKLESLAEESHWNLLKKSEKDSPSGKGLEYPHYTRPEVLKYGDKKYRAPKVLLTGNHQKIAEWRKKHAK